MLAFAQGGYLSFATGENPFSATAADLNSDGKPDLVIANSGSNSLTILLNDGHGGFTQLAPLSLPLAPREIVAVDLNGDRKIDLAVTGDTTVSLPSGGQTGLVTLLGNGDGTFRARQPVVDDRRHNVQRRNNASGHIDMETVAPALFTVNSSGLAAGYILRVKQNGDRTYEPIYQIDASGNITPLPIDLGPDTDTVYLTLYGTGIRNLSRWVEPQATFQSIDATITYLGPQGVEDALDQVNIQLPRTLATSTPSEAFLRIIVDGQPSNEVTIPIQ